MGFVDEYPSLDATALASRIRAGELSAAECVEAAQTLLARYNPTLNAVVRDLPDTARRLLREHSPEAPFAGVPFMLKDLLAQLQGTVMSRGSAALRHHVSPLTSSIVQRCLDAGLIVIGKTNTPELGLTGTTEPVAFGPTCNPYDERRTPGGSSGGSAAAVAAGIVPMALASDGGGSIRIPASCCGLFGLKPSRGRTPDGPDCSDVWEGASVQHVLTRSVRDSAAMLDLLCGPDAGSQWPVARPRMSYREACERDPRPLRVAFSTRSPLGGHVAQPCVDAVRRTGEFLADLGHDVQPAAPDLDGESLSHAYLTLYMGQVAAEVQEIAGLLGISEANLDVERPTRALARLGAELSARDYVATRRLWNHLAQAMAHFHEHFDLWLTPTLADLPQRLGALYPSFLQRQVMRLSSLPLAPKLAFRLGTLERMGRRLLDKTPFTQLANLTGQPAMSMPMHMHDGLPVGVQFVAPLDREDMLFELAGQLERAHPWPRIAPGY